MLKLAYEAAGYDVDAHISETDFLGKKRLTRNDPFLIPMLDANAKSPGSKRDKTKTVSKKSEPKPEGTKCWLPYLPLCGINSMSYSQVFEYWKPVMHAVLPERKRFMGYESSE